MLMWLSCLCFLSFEVILQFLSFVALTLLKNTGQLFVIGISKVSVFIFKHSSICLRKISVRIISVRLCVALRCEVRNRTSSQECVLRSHLLPRSLAFSPGPYESISLCLLKTNVKKISMWYFFYNVIHAHYRKVECSRHIWRKFTVP